MELEGRTLLQATVRDITEEKRVAEALRAAKEERRSGQPGQEHVPGQHEPRDPHAAERHHRHDGTGPEDAAVRRSSASTCRRVKDAGEALLSVINDILDFSKIEAGKLVLDRVPFDLRESLGDTMKSLAIRAHQKGLELAFYIHPDVPRRVVGDYSRLRQIVVNLVGNAIKFTDQGEVRAGGRPRVAGWPRGRAALHRQRHGHRHPRGEADGDLRDVRAGRQRLTRRHGGTGLGLAIASRLVEPDGRPRSGSRAKSARAAASTSPCGWNWRTPPRRTIMVIVPACLHGIRVLVVDDNATNRRILEEVLRTGTWCRRWPPARRGAGRTARGPAAGTPYRLVLTDAHMPDVDGFMLAEQIRQDPALAAPS